MSNRRGLTLIEIIVSMALLGIISVGLLGVFGNNFNFLNINRDMTKKMFAGQQDMELEIESIKDQIYDGNTPVSTIADITETEITDAFGTGISLNAYQLKYSRDNKDMYTLITDTRPPELEVPEAINVKATLRKDTTPVTRAYAEANVNVLGSSSIEPDTSHLFMVNNYNWYVSRPGFNIPMPPDSEIDEIEIGNKYPKFPEDYSLIPTSTNVNLDVIPAYAGRHIVFAVTPAAKSGKLGKTVPSKPVYISGLPSFGSDLIFHVDASLIDKDEADEVTKSGDDLFVQKWIDLTSNAKHAVKGTTAPKLKTNPLAVDFVGNYVDFDAGTTLNVTLLNSLSNAHVIAVVRDPGNSVFFTGNSASINTSGDPVAEGSSWTIVSAPNITSGKSFVLGNSNVDVAEVIIYKNTLNNTELQKVKDYLIEKYKALAINGKIVQLRPMGTIEILKNSIYTLPMAITAEMEYGPDMYAPVTWVPGIVDTTNVGTYNFEATSINSPDKSTTLTLKVIEPVLVTSVSLNKTTLKLNVGETETLKETVLPANATNKNVAWSSSNSSIATVDSNGYVVAISAGTVDIIVKTEDGGKTAKCVLEVISTSNWVDSLILHLDSNIGVMTNVNGRVSDWEDQSGNDNHFVKASDPSRPNLKPNGFNEMPVVHFTQDRSRYMLLNKNVLKLKNGEEQDFYPVSGNEFSILLIAKADKQGSTFISKSGGWANQATYAFGRQNNSQFVHVLRGHQSYTTMSSSVVNEFNLHTMIYLDNLHSYSINKLHQQNNTIGTYTNQTDRKITLGAAASGGQYYLDGDIAEVMVFNKALTNSERTEIEDMLYEKWFTAPKLQYNFTNDAESWTAISGVSAFKWENGGAIGGTILDGDPYIHSPNIINTSTNDIKTIKIKLKNNTSSSEAQLYYRTSMGSWDEARRINFPIIANSNEYVEYVIDMSSATGWTGNLLQLRIDPATNNTGSFSIDYVRFYD